MSQKRQAMWFDGVAAWGDYLLEDPVAFSVIQDLKMLTHNQGDGKGEVEWPIGYKVSGQIRFTAMNSALLAALTGGSAATGTIKRIRQGAETHTISENTITLAQTSKVVFDTLRLFGGNGTVFAKVAESPAVGEYSVVEETGVVTFNAAETETTIYPDYLYTDSAAGQTVTVSPQDLPSEITLYGSLRTKEVNAGTMGDIVIYLRNVNRKGPLEIGGDNAGSTKEFTVEYSAIISAEGDMKFYFPA